MALVQEGGFAQKGAVYTAPILCKSLLRKSGCSLLMQMRRGAIPCCASLAYVFLQEGYSIDVALAEQRQFHMTAE